MRPASKRGSLAFNVCPSYYYIYSVRGMYSHAYMHVYDCMRKAREGGGRKAVIR